MKFIKKVNIGPYRQEQSKTQRKESPGPGSYDIALPLIRPNYETIKKKNDIIILKINHLGDSCNFRSQQQRFPDEKERSPGPAQYGQMSLQLKKKQQGKRYSQRYTDLIQFMYRDRNHIGPIPDYKVQYQDEYQKALRRIKNSHRRYKQKEKQGKFQLKPKIRKQSICSTSTIVKIKSSSRLSINSNQHSIHLVDQAKNEDNNESKQKERKQLKTIDFPGGPSDRSDIKRAISLQKEQSLMLHRESFYNRNMLGMLMAKKKKMDKITFNMEESEVRETGWKQKQNQIKSTIDENL